MKKHRRSLLFFERIILISTTNERMKYHKKTNKKGEIFYIHEI